MTPTTTTTTTTQPTTTTTTTTLAPTTTTTTTTASLIVCENWEILNGAFVNIIDYQDCLGNPQQLNLDPSEIVGCFSVNSNAFGVDIPFLGAQPFTFNRCTPTTTTTSTTATPTTTTTTTTPPTTTTTTTPIPTTTTTTTIPTTTTTTTVTPPTTTTTTTSSIVCENWEIINGAFDNVIDYIDCSGNFQQLNLLAEEIVGCFSVDSNGFGPDIPFLGTQPYTFSKCPVTTTITTTPIPPTP